MNKYGRLDFHSETGTEGGYFAFQDAEHIQQIYSDWGLFAGQKVQDPKDPFRGGRVLEAYGEDGTKFTSAKPGDVSYLRIKWEDGEITGDLVRSDNVLVERWLYDGLVLLKPRDRLTIYASGIGGAVLWSGLVEMERQDDPYAESSYAPYGLASHYKPRVEGIDADSWSKFFFEGNFANLERE